MRIQHNKLVRDRIPEIIHQSGKKCGTRSLNASEYRQALRRKLVEEATEAAKAPQGDLMGELADLWEVISSLAVAYGFQEEAIERARKRKRVERGGFESKIELLWVEE